MTKVFLGMSGGVDSSTAAVLLREQGYTVHGLHLSLLRGLPLSTEHPVEDGAAAAAAAAQLGIPFHDADLSGQFREAVISYFVRTYQEGQTPNPCVVCNRRIKFGACGIRLVPWARTASPPGIMLRSDGTVLPAGTCCGGGPTGPRTRATFSAG